VNVILLEGGFAWKAADAAFCLQFRLPSQIASVAQSVEHPTQAFFKKRLSEKELPLRSSFQVKGLEEFVSDLLTRKRMM